jgi:hypothetical protein
MNGHDDLRPFTEPQKPSIWTPILLIVGAAAAALFIMFSGAVIW